MSCNLCPNLCHFVTCKTWTFSPFLYFIPSKMNTKAVYNYFSEVLENDPEKLAVLDALMSINGDEQGIIDFIDYYGFDTDELIEKIDNWYYGY